MVMREKNKVDQNGKPIMEDGRYTREFRTQAVAEARQEGVKVVAERYGLTVGVIYYWIKHPPKDNLMAGPAGEPNSLPPGFVKQFAKLRRLRASGQITEEEEELVGRCLQRMIDVMEQRVPPSYANFVLNAAYKIREEALGMLTSKVEVSGKLTLEAALEQALRDDKDQEEKRKKPKIPPKLVKQLESPEVEEAEIVE